MFKIVMAAVVAFSFASLDSADAASKRKRQKVRSAPVVTMPAKPVIARTPGPSWAGPNDCFTDEGYGRYWPCGAGKDD
jgi:hypothetical protein